MVRREPRKFPYMFEVDLPPDVDKDVYMRMYPYYFHPVNILFGKDAPRELLDFERNMFMFFDAIHHPEPLAPMDFFTTVFFWTPGLAVMNTRIFAIPPAGGFVGRVIRGHLFHNSLPVTDPEVLKRKAVVFERRAMYYYQNWDRIYRESWIPEVLRLLEEMKALEFKDLPELESDKVVFEHMGVPVSAQSLVENWWKLVFLLQRLWWKHFEMLNLGYAAYGLFYQFMKQKFPDITDQHIALMVAGIDVILYEPDRQLRRLARLAVELGIADRLLSYDTVDKMERELQVSGDENSRRWLKEWSEVKDKWFSFTVGTGFNHQEPRWNEDPNIPFRFLKDYIERIKRGESIETATEQLRKQRDEIAKKYADLLSEEDRRAFYQYLEIARTVYTYVEDHVLYIHHWAINAFRAKAREVGSILHRHGFLESPDDIFYMTFTDVYYALMDLITSWAGEMPAVGKYYWPKEIRARKEILEKLRQNRPPPAVGEPKPITDPFIYMLWGVTEDRINEWLETYYGKPEEVGKVIRGIPASPGVVEGRAVVVRSVGEFGKVREGDIVVCPFTDPSWVAIFSKARAVVTDIGGLMSHAAIVAREYGIPAVVGTGNATKLLRDGQRVRVDAIKGVVEVLE